MTERLILELEEKNARLTEALQNVLVETNFISLQAARSYIQEVLENEGTKCEHGNHR